MSSHWLFCSLSCLFFPRVILLLLLLLANSSPSRHLPRLPRTLWRRCCRRAPSGIDSGQDWTIYCDGVGERGMKIPTWQSIPPPPPPPQPASQFISLADFIAGILSQVFRWATSQSMVPSSSPPCPLKQPRRSCKFNSGSWGASQVTVLMEPLSAELKRRERKLLMWRPKLHLLFPSHLNGEYSSGSRPLEGTQCKGGFTFYISYDYYEPMKAEQLFIEVMLSCEKHLVEFYSEVSV